MPRISTDNYDTVASWNGSQDLFVVEQPDGTKVATPAMVKQYVLNDMDEVPTQNSNDTVKSGGVFSAVDDVYSVMGQMGAKNLLVPEWVETQTTEKGVTYTFNVDGTITMNTDASGATDNIDCNLRSKDEITNNLFPAGSYTLTGCPSGGSSTTYRMWVRAYRPNTDTPLTSNLYDNGNGVSFTVSEPFSLVLTAAVRKNYVCNNLTFKPMLRLASDTDDTYQPYAKTNRQLTEVIGDLSQTGLTGNSVAAQLGTAKEQIADVTSGIENITRKDLSANDENAFLTLAYAGILSDMGAFVAEAPKCVTRIYTWYGHDNYIINAYRVQSRWIYSFCFTEGKAYYITYDCNNNSIVIKKSFTLT